MPLPLGPPEVSTSEKEKRRGQAECGNPIQDQGPCQLKQQEAQSFNETKDRMIWKGPETRVTECLVYEYHV